MHFRRTYGGRTVVLWSWLSTRPQYDHHHDHGAVIWSTPSVAFEACREVAQQTIPLADRRMQTLDEHTAGCRHDHGVPLV